MTRVLITRPETGATRTLDALLAKGIKATAIALSEIQSMEFHKPTGDFDALIVTSQNAIIHGAAALGRLTSKPLFVVGKRTAEAAQSTGHTIAAWAETAEQLLPIIITEAPTIVIYLCGQTRRPELELGLKSAGISVQAVEVYRAITDGSARVKLETFFLSSENTIVQFHAPSAVQAFMEAVNIQKVPEGTRFLCLSAAIAAELPAKWQNQISIAEHPNETAMINQLDKMLARDHFTKA